MNREHALATLRDHEPELKAFGVVTASVRVARNDAGQDFDVDVAGGWPAIFPKAASITSASWRNSNSSFPSSSAAKLT
jgi:hypothetical protein